MPPMVLTRSLTSYVPGLLQRPPISIVHGSVFQPLLAITLGSSFESPPFVEIVVTRDEVVRREFQTLQLESRIERVRKASRRRVNGRRQKSSGRKSKSESAKKFAAVEIVRFRRNRGIRQFPGVRFADLHRTCCQRRTVHLELSRSKRTFPYSKVKTLAFKGKLIPPVPRIS